MTKQIIFIILHGLMLEMKRLKMKKSYNSIVMGLSALFLSTAFLTACDNGYSPGGRAGTGALIGGGGGAAIGALAGGGTGAAIGALSGAALGAGVGAATTPNRPNYNNNYYYQNNRGYPQNSHNRR